MKKNHFQLNLKFWNRIMSWKYNNVKSFQQVFVHQLQFYLARVRLCGRKNWFCRIDYWFWL